MRTVWAVLMMMLALNLQAQKEAATWYFGQNAGLDFNTGDPTPLLDGQINTIEGCATISDAEGELLFYTEGRTVWNRTHQVMPNGTDLEGSFSTAQAALIVPNPEVDGLYYVFTPDDALSQQEDGSSNGFHYSVVDMNRANGLGDVIEKNTQLLAQSSEKVSAIWNAQGNFYWVVTQFRNQFYSYRVDGSGVDTNPVISTSGPWIEEFSNIRGSLKHAPDGSKLAITHTIVAPRYEGSFYVFDFDIDTGSVSNAISVDDSRLYYGVEFSSDSSKLYASGMQIGNKEGIQGLGNLEIVQYDLDRPDFTEHGVLVHRFELNLNTFVAGALQLGIDKRIYHAIPSQRLSVIRSPNRVGINTDFRPFAVALGGRLSTYGLPPFVQSFFETIIAVSNLCEGEKTTFEVDRPDNIASISWDFGDPASGTANFSNDLEPTHIFSGSGNYTVTVDVTYVDGSTRRFLEFVEIFSVPQIDQGIQLVQCDVDGQDDGLGQFDLNQAIAMLEAEDPEVTARFYLTELDATNDVNSIQGNLFNNTVVDQVLFARVFNNPSCFVVVSLDLVVRPMTDLGVYDRMFICDGTITETVTSFALNEVKSRLQSDFMAYDAVEVYASKDDALFENAPLVTVSYSFLAGDPQELFFRVETAGECAFIGSIDLIITERPDFEPVVSATLCRGKVVLNALPGYDSYQWPDGSSAPSYLATESRSVDVVFSNGPCMYLQTFEVEDEPGIGLEEIVVNDFQRNSSLEVLTSALLEDAPLRYSIDGGRNFQESNVFRNVRPGLYRLTIDNGCTTLEEDVLVGGTPAFFTPNSDGFNDRWTMMNQEFFPDYTISIFDRYGKLLRSFGEGQSWDGTFNNRLMPADDYWYHLTLADGRTVKGYFALKR